MAKVDINPGDVTKWADKMEERGADFAADIVRSYKRDLEQRRKEGKLKFVKVRRKKSGAKRFAQKKAGPQALVTGTAFQAHFDDIFKKNKAHK
jgi:hypothetical protein